MITISLCMIVKNEEKVLARCLESVKDVVDEIIIVDTGSTDKTKEIAKKYTKNVIDFKWIDDFSSARNFSFSHATKEYIMWLDADDVVLPQDKEKILILKKNLKKDTDIVMMKYVTATDKNGTPTFFYYRERLIRKESNLKWVSPIHEVIPLSGKLIYTDINITHKSIKSSYSTRNLDIFKSMLNKGITLDARQQYYYARELMYNKKYCSAIMQYNKYLEMKDGWIENKIQACIELASCYLQENCEDMYLQSLFRSFEIDKPRAPICSLVGIFFMQKSKYKLAIYWFKQAYNIKPNYKSGEFIQEDYYNFIPYINLCYCYSMLGKYNLARKYNDKALKIKPDNIKAINNKKYLDSI